eukprot:5663978-Ditylum_brightwellii.AAC.1
MSVEELRQRRNEREAHEAQRELSIRITNRDDRSRMYQDQYNPKLSRSFVTRSSINNVFFLSVHIHRQEHTSSSEGYEEEKGTFF